MPTDYIFLFCIALALYFYSIQNNQIRSTASAIRSVFAGECRLACRQSQASDISGLSSLQGAGPSRNFNRVGANCICESCPCAVIEQFLRTCSPATRMYTTFLAMMSQIYCNIIASVIGTTSYSSEDNFAFKESDKEDLCSINSFDNNDKPPIQNKSSLSALKEKIISKTSVSIKSASLLFQEFLGKRKSKAETEASNDDAVDVKPTASKAETEASNDDAVDVKPTASKTSQVVPTSSRSGDCPKCVEKGKTCLRECPEAKK